MVGTAAADFATRAAIWQTGIAVVQAVCSVTLLGWYVLAAHLDRVRGRRERLEDFRSLVCLCRDLGLEARAKTEARVEAIRGSVTNATAELARWKSDMTVIYVCLNEAPHYEVRNPAFSTALTRLWLEVDTRTAPANGVADQDILNFLTNKASRIGAEVKAMAGLLADAGSTWRSTPNLSAKAPRRGYAYNVDGSASKR